MPGETKAVTRSSSIVRCLRDYATLAVVVCRSGRWLVSGKIGRARNAGIDFRTGFLAISERSEQALSNHQETGRFSDEHPSQPFRADRYDLASVSMIVRPFSNSVRRTVPSISTNVRQKSPMIARRGVHHCASLHLTSRACPLVAM